MWYQIWIKWYHLIFLNYLNLKLNDISFFVKKWYERADRVRGRGRWGAGGGEEGREEGEEGAGGGRRGGGRREKRGWEEGLGRKKGREGKRAKFCAREARAAPEGRRETRGREGEGPKPPPLSTPSDVTLRINMKTVPCSFTIYSVFLDIKKSKNCALVLRNRFSISFLRTLDALCKGKIPH